MQGEVEMNWNSETGEVQITFRPERAAKVQVILPEKWAEGLKLGGGEPFVNGSVLDLSQTVTLKR